MKHLRRSFLLSGLIAVSIAAGAPAEQRAGRIQVLVSPDHPDWKYRLGEKPVFTIRAVRDGANVGNLRLTYSAGPEMMTATETTVTLSQEGLKVDGGTLRQPGFIRCIATVEENGHKYRGLATAGFEPEKIQPVTPEPADFDAFWQAGKDALAAIPIDAERTLMPELSTAKVNVYHVSLQNIGPGGNGTSRIFGMLCEPKAPGKFPALLGVPGAGVHPIRALVKEAEAGAITLAIGIHGIPLTLETRTFGLLGSGALNGYWAFNLDSRDRYYYRRVYLGCVRANDYLTSLPNWDGKTLAVTGGSQGGALSIITAGLDPRVQAVAAYYPALSDMAGYTKERAGGWPHMFKADGAGSNRTKEKLETAAYYDVVNFARRVKAPGMYSFGFNDEVCPPTSIYAAYNVIPGAKKTVLALETGHWTVPEQTELVSGWLEEFLRTGRAN